MRIYLAVVLAFVSMSAIADTLRCNYETQNEVGELSWLNFSPSNPAFYREIIDEDVYDIAIAMSSSMQLNLEVAKNENRSTQTLNLGEPTKFSFPGDFEVYTIVCRVTNP